MIDCTLQEVLKRKFYIADIENSLSKLGEGAWHEVYKLKRNEKEELVLRIKKLIAYGEKQTFDLVELMTEYESSKAYYHQANLCSVDVCPTFYDYYVDDHLVFTLESFMGTSLTLQGLSPSDTFLCGEKLGAFFRLMHKKTPAIKGFGSLTWTGTKLKGERLDDPHSAWKKDNDNYQSILEKLKSAQLDLLRPDVIERLHKVIESRRQIPQKIAFVNQDVTPENLILGTDQVAVIDPFPRLDFDLKYAGYFVFCYTFLLPAYSKAPRYQHHDYDGLRPIMKQLADGFIKGYFGPVMEAAFSRLQDEVTLWLLQETFEHFECLNEKEVSQKTLLQMGDQETIHERFQLCLRELERRSIRS